jgi:hypothetical protein
MLFLSLISKISLAQKTYFGITYQGSLMTNNLPNFKSLVYEWNHEDFANFEDKFEYKNFFHGLGFEYGGFNRDGWHFFTGWENKHFSTHGSGNYVRNGASFEGDITVKIRHNIFHTFGIGHRLGSKVVLGIAPIDVGSFKVIFKDKKSDKPDEWQNVYNSTTGLFSQHSTLGATFYSDFYPKKFLRLRVSGYFEYFKNDLGVGPFYVYQPNSLSLQAALILGGNK